MLLMVHLNIPFHKVPYFNLSLWHTKNVYNVYTLYLEKLDPVTCDSGCDCPKLLQDFWNEIGEDSEEPPREKAEVPVPASEFSEDNGFHPMVWGLSQVVDHFPYFA